MNTWPEQAQHLAHLITDLARACPLCAGRMAACPVCRSIDGMADVLRERAHLAAAVLAEDLTPRRPAKSAGHVMNSKH